MWRNAASSKILYVRCYWNHPKQNGIYLLNLLNVQGSPWNYNLSPLIPSRARDVLFSFSTIQFQFPFERFWILKRFLSLIFSLRPSTQWKTPLFFDITPKEQFLLRLQALQVTTDLTSSSLALVVLFSKTFIKCHPSKICRRCHRFHRLPYVTDRGQICWDFSDWAQALCAPAVNFASNSQILWFSVLQFRARGSVLFLALYNSV